MTFCRYCDKRTSNTNGICTKCIKLDKRITKEMISYLKKRA